MWCDDGGEVFREASLTDLDEVAKKFIEKAGNSRVWLFYGEMGSGKTTFIKSLCNQLGVSDAMSSPTFSIVNEYLTRTNTKIFHFDFYRIKNEAEAYDIGTEEYFYSGNYCFVEWPEKIPSLIPAERIDVAITSSENQTQRTLAISVHDGKEKNRI
jgi:tRNA threonylcarbamoyladenosine biosynthesis protein TsaE